MKRRVSFLAGSVLALVLIGGRGDTASAEEPVRGEALYVKHCSGCHAMDGGGDTPLAALFRVPPPDLRQIAMRRGGWFPEVLVREIVDGRFMAHGAKTMPVWGGTLSQMQLIAVTEHLYGLQQSPPKAGDLLSH